MTSKSGTLETQAFVVRSTDYGEADRILHLLTRNRGKLAVLAKAARRSKRRFGAALSPYTLIQVRVRPRRSGLWLLTEATVVETFFKIPASLPRMALAGYFTELARETVPERKPEPEIFDLLHSALRLLDKTKPNRALVRSFETNLLHRLGLTPQLQQCTAPGCGRDISPAMDPPNPEDLAQTVPPQKAQYGFSPALGGILCPHCATRHPSIPMDAGAVASMTLLSRLGIAEAALLPRDIPESVNEQIKAALAPILLDLVGHPLKSVAFINQLQKARLPQNGGKAHDESG